MKLASFGAIPPQWGGRSAGGVASYHAATLQALSDFCPDITEITVVPSTWRETSTNLPRRCNLLPLKAHDRTEKRISELADGHDVLIAHHITDPWAEAFVDAGRANRLVGVVHSWTKILADPSQRARQQYLLDSCGALVFPSHHAISKGATLGLVIREDTTVTYGPLIEPFVEMPAPYFTEREKILFVGTLNDLKRCGLLIEAIARLPNYISLTVVGDGPLRESLAAQCVRLGLSSRITFTGNLDPANLCAAYRSHSLLCVPSRSESFGLVYVEALSQGMPVIGYQPSVDEISDAIAKKCGLGFGGDSVNELARLILLGLERHWDREALSSATRARFSLERSAQTMMCAIRSVQV